MMNLSLRTLCAAGALLASSATAAAGVDPLLKTTWGQDGVWQSALPADADGELTYAGCTTIAAAQVLFYYQHQATASSAVEYVLDHPVTGPDIEDDWLSSDLTSRTHDWSAMALSEDESKSRIDATADFIYDVAVSLNAQFGDPSGSPATARFVENAFRYQWGYNAIARRSMFIISKDIFGYSDDEWAALIYAELDAGRPVLYMAQQINGDAGHAFVIDGYRDDGQVHVSWGWGGLSDGYYDPNVLSDHRDRAWSRAPMIYLGLEPTAGHAATIAPPKAESSGYQWTGSGSLISRTSGTATGYGLTRDEATFDSSAGAPAVFFQWEVDTRDGEALVIDADSSAGASVDVVYGRWDDRSGDRIHRSVTLPFVLDPSADGLTDLDGEYFVVAVLMDNADGGGIVSAATTTTTGGASDGLAGPVQVGDHAWSGSASVISYTSGTATGYGLTQDETSAHPGEVAPAVFFQWEVDTRDGDELLISADSGRRATISYGPWNGDRADDITQTVALPYVVSPATDGLSADSGEYYVVQVAFEEAPSA
ncbi:MAG: hypothetical protein ACI8S6_005587, partial [Myxococcota bacterium]